MAKTVLYVVGAVLVVVGILGFFNDPVLGIFEVDGMHNLVHIVTGLVLLWGGYAGGSQARSVAIVLGLIYALVAVLGLVLPGDTVLGIIESNLADDLLHVVLAVVLLYVGFTAAKDTGSSSAPPAPSAPAGGGNMPPQQ